MPRISPPIYLTASERSELEKNVKGHKVEKRLFLRSQIVLLAAEGVESVNIAKELNLSEKTCRKWRHRFEKKRLGGIVDLERSGAPETFTEEERLSIIHLACTQPPILKNWTLANIAEQAREKIGKSVSIETVRKILKTADSKTASSLPPNKNKLFIKQSRKK